MPKTEKPKANSALPLSKVTKVSKVTTKKRKPRKHLTTDIKTEKKPPDNNLNPKQERFCQLYASDREFFGNGTQSYIEAYEPDKKKPNWYKSAMSSASRLLSNVKIYTRINSIMEETGYNDVAVDKQTSFLIHQHADFTNKLGAIREYNKIKNRYPAQKVEHSGKVDVIEITNYATPDQKEPE